jgi:hypothetical protein
MGFVVFVVGGLIGGLLPALIARSKGHNFIGWYVFGFLLSIVALPCALLLDKGVVYSQKLTVAAFLLWVAELLIVLLFVFAYARFARM